MSTLETPVVQQQYLQRYFGIYTPVALVFAGMFAAIGWHYADLPTVLSAGVIAVHSGVLYVTWRGVQAGRISRALMLMGIDILIGNVIITILQPFLAPPLVMASLLVAVLCLPYVNPGGLRALFSGVSGASLLIMVAGRYSPVPTQLPVWLVSVIQIGSVAALLLLLLSLLWQFRLRLQLLLTQLRDANAALVASNHALEQERASLEGTVAQRTAELYVAKEVAEAANHAKSTFLATISHEVRTPLNAVINYTGFLRDLRPSPPDDTDHAHFVTRIMASADHLLELFTDMLDLSRIEMGQLTLQRTPTDLQPLLEEAVAITRTSIATKPIELRTDVPTPLPCMTVDARRLHQVLLNLLANAAKFTEQGTITVQATADDASVTMAVRDTGIGIAPTDQIRIFDAFQQVQDGMTRRYGGTGLGLAICRYLVEAHGGTLTVQSTLGQGSTFTITLPRETEEGNDATTDDLLY